MRVLFMPIRGIYLICITLVGVFLFSFYYQKIEDFFIYYPDSSLDAQPADWQLNCEEVWFDTQDREKLHGWFFPLKGDTPVILFCHGNAGNMSHRLDNVRRLLERDIRVFIFDYRGYGKSTGKPSEAGLYLDGQAAHDFLVNIKHIKPGNIVPFGRSLGAAVAIELSLTRRIRSLIIESAFTSTKEMAKAMFLFKAFAFFFPAHFNNLEKITRITAPILIFHGEKDEIVPFAMGRKLFQAARQPKYFYPIKKAGHNDTYFLGGAAYFKTLAAFVKDSEI